MLPLGDAWAGVCRAIPDQPFPPDEPTLLALCNLGYAREGCPRFPPQQEPDAVRFAISCDDGSSVRICYAVERDHYPLAHGAFDYALAGGNFSLPPPSDVFGRQARAYLSTYLRRKQAASRP